MKIRTLFLAFLFLSLSSCEYLEIGCEMYDAWLDCQNQDEPTMLELAIVCDDLIGNTYGEIPDISNGYTGTQGEDVNWARYSKVGYIAGSGSYKFYHIGQFPDNVFPIPQEDPDDKIPGFRTDPNGIFDIEEFADQDSAIYRAKQIKVKVGGIVGPNAVSDGGNTGLSVIAVKECIGWAVLGDPIVLTHDEF